MVDVLLRNGAAGAGICEAGVLRPWMTERMSARLQTLPFAPVTALVGSFPYNTGDSPGNIALFARVTDYHAAVFARVCAAASELAAAYPAMRFHPLKNGWPLPVVQAARLAGVAFVGRHGLAIDPVYGSYIALSAVLCDTALPPSAPLGFCGGCENGGSACAAVCPTGALCWDGERRVFERSLCISHITQKPCGDPSVLETLKRSPYIWGCDLCQRACPHNRGAALTALPEFLTGVVTNLEPADLGSLPFWSDRHYAGSPHLIVRNMRALK